MKNKNKISYMIFSKKYIRKIQKKIDMLGDNVKYDANFFLNIRLFSSVIVFLVVLYLSEWGYLLAPIITLVYYVGLEYIVIDQNLKKRSDTLDVDAMTYFEVMSLALESGYTLKSAIELACDNVDNELSKEFRKTLVEVDYGKGFNEALEGLKQRIPSDIVNNIILNIMQSNLFGNNIKSDMYRQLDFIRDREIFKTKAIISKIPIKVSVISVLFYIPLILLLILSPVIIQYFS